MNNSELEAKVTTLIEKSKGSSVANSDLHALLDLLQELDRREATSGIEKWFRPDSPYSIANLPKHAAFIAATKFYREVLLLGGNRSGKTTIGAFVCAVVATGLYPDWWDEVGGIRFDGPVDIWAVGKTGQTTRDTVQAALMGQIGEWGTGMIPADCIGRRTRAIGTPDLLDVVEVKHVNGGWSKIGFKTYKQEVQSFFGTARHVVWLDEPCPEDIYSECLIRTAVLPGGAEGRILHTITPKDGLTRLLADFLANCDLLAGTEYIEGVDKARALRAMHEGAALGDAVTILYGDQTPGVPAAKHRAAVAISWDDTPWMTEKTKHEILESTPLHLRDTVSKGIPTVGDGSVYPYPLSDVLVDNFQIPAHYEKMYGMDASWNCTAAVFGAKDPDTGTLYIYGEHYLQKREPEIHAARIKTISGDWQIGAIDPASKKLKGPRDGIEMLSTYRRLGLRLREANNALESGITKVRSMLAQGKLKFFKSTTLNLQNEYLVYRYDDNKIADKGYNDHALDSLRYLVGMLQFAKPTPSSTANAAGVRGPLIQVSRRYNV